MGLESVFNRQRSPSILDYRAATKVPNVYGVPSSFIQGDKDYYQPQMPYADMYNQGQNPSYSSFLNKGNGLELDDYMKFAGNGIGIGSGLMGIYGQIQGNKRGNEAMDMARQNQRMNQQAANQYSQFRTNTKSAFA